MRDIQGKMKEQYQSIHCNIHVRRKSYESEKIVDNCSTGITKRRIPKWTECSKPKMKKAPMQKRSTAPSRLSLVWMHRLFHVVDGADRITGIILVVRWNLDNVVGP
jgi:hypothetical protein